MYNVHEKQCKSRMYIYRLDCNPSRAPPYVIVSSGQCGPGTTARGTVEDCCATVSITASFSSRYAFIGLIHLFLSRSIQGIESKRLRERERDGRPVLNVTTHQAIPAGTMNSGSTAWQAPLHFAGSHEWKKNGSFPVRRLAFPSSSFCRRFLDHHEAFPTVA